MNNYKNSVFIISAVIITALLSCTGMYFFNKSKNRKTGYIETNVLFSKYKGRLKIQDKLMKDQNAQKLIMDSIKLEYEATSRLYNSSGGSNNSLVKKMQNLEMRYNYLGTEFKKLNETESQKAMDEIWTQLNQFIKDYGKANSYTYIYGASGDGSLMYADDNENITNDLIEFSNNKYAGK